MSGGLALGAARSSAFAERAHSLRATWNDDIALGVPEFSIAPLRAQLQAQRSKETWWDPVSWTTDGETLLDRLQQETDSVFASAVNAERNKAQLLLSARQEEVTQDHQYIPVAALAAAQAWSAQLGAATSPAAVAALIARWQPQVDATRTAVAQARLAAEVAAAGGPMGLIAQATTKAPMSTSSNLGTGDVTELADELRSELSSGASTTATADQLYVALDRLQEALSGVIAGEMRPIYLTALQAEAEGAPGAAGLMREDTSASAAFGTDSTYAELSSLQGQLTGLQSVLASDLSADRCDHDVGSGKVISVSLTLQEAVFYDNGCVVSATPVTTGRPGNPTPTGDFTILTANSPYEIVSPLAPTISVEYADLFTVGSNPEWLHDASWEDPNAFGPGSEYGSSASFGCIQFPTPVMAWLFNWAPLGTPVIVSA